MMELIRNDKFYFRLILIISILIPIVVAGLLYLPVSQDIRESVDVKFLPAFNAFINSMVSILLVSGLILIRNGKREAHRLIMLTSFFLSALFLVSYIIYHTLSVEGETTFGGTGTIRYVYFFILITHIILAAAIVPLVLFTMYRAMTGQFQKHKRLARWTFPLWLYVSITGVVVYLMISPYYK